MPATLAGRYDVGLAEARSGAGCCRPCSACPEPYTIVDAGGASWVRDARRECPALGTLNCFASTAPAAQWLQLAVDCPHVRSASEPTRARIQA